MGKRKAGEKRRQVIDFNKAACYLSAVVQRAAWQKNDFCEGSSRGK